MAGQAGDAVTGLQTMPDPLASLTPAARMALSVGSPPPSVSALGPAAFGLLRDAFGGYGPGLMAAALATGIGAAVLMLGARRA